MSAIDEIKQRLDIIVLVSEYVPLKKVGRNFQGLCPFHTEKTPSFFVFPERQTWHCYGACSTGGDIFTFLMKREGVEFTEALRTLSQRAGVTLPTREVPGRGENERILNALDVATKFYHELLMRSREGEMARSFISKRGVHLETAQKFLLGYSPAGWEGLKEALLKKGFSQSELVTAGLLVERESEGTYDRFRHRLMFPIQDAKGRVVGFGARALDDSLPKYINSSQSPFFDKGGILYGLDKARQGIKSKDQAIIVEGYMDVVIPHQAGFDNVVASMGTSLTQKQISLLMGISRNIVLCLDPDTAGKEATQRSLDTTWQEFNRTRLPIGGMQGATFYQRAPQQPTLKVMLLPQGKDPDEVVLEDLRLWRELVEKAMGFIEFGFQSEALKHDLKSPEGKSAMLNALLPKITALENPFAQDEYFEKLAQMVGTDPRTLKGRLSQPSRGSSRVARQRTRGASEVLPSKVEGDPLEESCLSLLLNCPDLREEGMKITPEYFLRGENREIFTRWQKEPIINLTEDYAGDVIQDHLARLLSMSPPPSTPRRKELALMQAVVRLEERRLKELEEGIAHARAQGETNPMLDSVGKESISNLKKVFAKRQKLEKEINAAL